MQSLLERKIGFLQKHVSPSLTNSIFRQSLEYTGTATKLSPSFQETVALSLAYCFCKNLKWLHLSIFKEVAVDFMVTDLQIDRNDSNELFDRLKAKLAPYSEEGQAEALTEDAFFEYIVSSSLSSVNNHELLLQLGFGDGILKRLNSAVEKVDSPTEQQSIEFLPSIDAALVKAIDKVIESNDADEYKQEVHSLASLLADHLPPEIDALALATKTYKNVFDCVCRGNHFQTDRIDLQSIAGADTDQLEQALRKADFIHQVSAKSCVKAATWMLSDRAYRLVGHDFAEWFCKNKSLLDITNYPPVLQKEVLLSMKDDQPDSFVGQCLTLIHKLSPLAIRTLLERFHHRQRDLVPKIFGCSKSLSNWQKEAFISAITDPIALMDVRQHLKNLAEFDSSERVRKAALDALIRERLHDNRPRTKEPVPKAEPVL